MEPQITIVTLGVANVAASAAFYERLGWKPSSAGNGSIVFFQLKSLVLALFGAEDLRHDANVVGSSAFDRNAGRFSLAQNVDSPDQVDAVLADAVAAGATLLKPGQKAFWGGYSGYFSDPDGHLWEIAHNPFFNRDASGQLQLPD